MPNTETIAHKLRLQVIDMLSAAGSGHSGASLGLADIFSVIYFSDLFNLNPNNPQDVKRDRIILSNGHACPILYTTLAAKGYFPETELSTLRQYGSRLQGHPHKDFRNNHHTSPTNLPGVENTAGPLGQGIGFAVGLSLGLRHQYQIGKIASLPRVVCICGDGELDEGQCWEAFMTASKYQLNHLTFILDRNGIQIDGFTKEVMPIEPIKDKLSSFGLLVTEVDGHNHDCIYRALKPTHHLTTKPTMIIAKTTMGKGVSFMENRPEWHGKAPSKEEADQARQELTKAPPSHD